MSKWIDADALIANAKKYNLGYYETDEWATPLNLLDDMPSIEIVRCKECVHYFTDIYFCKQFHVGTPEDGYCYMAKKAEQTEPNCYDCAHWDYEREVCCKGGGCEFRKRQTEQTEQKGEE